MDTPTYQYWTIVLWMITLVAGVATVTIYLFQWIRMGQGIKAQNLAWLIQYLQSKDVRDARSVVINELEAKAKWDSKDDEAAATACAAYGTAAVFLKLNRVDREVIIENWGPSIVLICHICRKLIAERRAKMGPIYWSALVWLNEEVVEELKKKNPTQTEPPIE